MKIYFRMCHGTYCGSYRLKNVYEKNQGTLYTYEISKKSYHLFKHMNPTFLINIDLQNISPFIPVLFGAVFVQNSRQILIFH